MDAWQHFLKQQQAIFAPGADLVPDIIGFHGSTSNVVATDVPQNFIAPLNLSGLIKADGAEAAHFLHNQLTNDVEHLPADQARLAGYCSVKGRLLASLLIWRHGESLCLQLPRAQVPDLQQHLQRFIMRAKVTLRDASAEQIVLGLSGTRATTVLHHWFEILPDAPYQMLHSDAGTLIRMADAPHATPRYQWLTSVDTAQAAWPRLIHELQPIGATAWRLQEIQNGIPHLTAATQDRFVPQMLNYELIGGVNFQKGCYPGQEIVARSQYLGKLKRRMLCARVASTNVLTGSEVFASHQPEQACGTIINAELDGPNHMLCLVELTLASSQNGSVHLASSDGPELIFQPLPYEIPNQAKTTLGT